MEFYDKASDNAMYEKIVSFIAEKQVHHEVSYAHTEP